MKTLIAAVIFAASASTASAQDLAFVGNAFYEFEAEQFETNLGVEMGFGDFTVTPMITGQYDDVDEFHLDNVSVTGAYSLNDNVDLFGRVEFDDEFEYSETTVGMAFRF